MRIILKLFFFGLIIINNFNIAQTNFIIDCNPSEFRIIKLNGYFGDNPIKMLLTFYPDSSVLGYFYDENDGRLFTFNKIKENKKIFFEAEPIELFIVDNKPRFKATIELERNSLENNDTLIGIIKIGDNESPLKLIKEKLKQDWRYLTIKWISYSKDTYFKEQRITYSTIFPSNESSNKVNNHFLDGFLMLDKNTVDFVNSQKSNYLLIENNLGEIKNEEDNYCWSDDLNSELVFISDSILTYRVYEFTLAHNGNYFDNFISINISNGEQYSFHNIFKLEFVDTVLTLLNKRYSDLKNVNSNYYDRDSTFKISDVSNIFLLENGIYFKDMDGNYYDGFLSYTELKPYLRKSFRKTIGLK